MAERVVGVVARQAKFVDATMLSEVGQEKEKKRKQSTEPAVAGGRCVLGGRVGYTESRARSGIRAAPTSLEVGG